MYSLDETAPASAGTSGKPTETHPGVVPDAEKEQFPQFPIVGGSILRGNLYIFKDEFDACPVPTRNPSDLPGTFQLHDYLANPKLSKDQLAEITLFLIAFTEIPTSGIGRGGELESQLLNAIAEDFTKNVLQKSALQTGEKPQQIRAVDVHDALLRRQTNTDTELIRPGMYLTYYDLYAYAYNFLRDELLKSPQQKEYCRRLGSDILLTAEAVRRVASNPEVLKDVEKEERLNTLAVAGMYEELFKLKTDKLRHEATFAFRFKNWLRNNF